MRKGKYIATVNVSEVTNEQLSEMMVGRKVMLQVKKGEPKLGEVALQVEELVVKAEGISSLNKVHHVSFEVRKGEIVAIAGVEGNGQAELVQAITGLLPVTSGKIFLNGKDITELVHPRTELWLYFAHSRGPAQAWFDLKFYTIQ